MTAPNRWFLLPGMGADSSMYDVLQAHLTFEVSFINWPKYGGEKSYVEVAKRVIDETTIMDGDIVGGSSLGGMIALEVARLKKLKAVVLIGSAIDPTEIQAILALLFPIAALTPISLIQLLVGKHQGAIARMFAEADPSFIRAMCRYLQEWPGFTTSLAPVYRIHGQKDHVIPCPRAGCEIIENAGHLVAVTHSKKCAEALNRIKTQLTTS